MKEVIETIAKLIAELEAETERTPWLEMALGGLRTAAANLESHERHRAKAEEQ
ncbi:MAG TPA: hypothetical protein P5169_00875 [Kiritimatiellia bacterium]|nr:hypothetical protein [Kiritimatiellia bacterium]